MTAWAGVLVWAPRRLTAGVASSTSWGASVALAGLGCGVFALAPGAPGGRLELALLVQTAAAIAAFDLRWLLIPDLYSAALALAGFTGPLSPGIVAAVTGAVVGAALLGGVRWAAGRWLDQEAMGLGDVKLAAALGALLGPSLLLWTIAAAAGLGALVGLVVQAWRGGRPRLPLGAFLAPTGVALLWLARE